MATTLSEITTLDEARSHVREHLKEGTVCPCCGQTARLYRRSINQPMARGLEALFRLDAIENVAYHIGEIYGPGIHTGDFSKLAYWGLIWEGDDRPGLWKITAKGKDFVEGSRTVAKFAFVYGGKCESMSGPEVSFLDCIRASKPELLAA